MEELHKRMLAVPERRVFADQRRRAWWAGATIVATIGTPVLIVCLLPISLGLALGTATFALCLAAVMASVGIVRGIVVCPTLDDEAIENKTRTRAQETLKVAHAN